MTNMLEMTWQEVDEARKRGVPVALPLGSMEQHGPQTPLGTDTYIAQGIIESVAQTRELLIAPPFVYAAYSRPKSGGGRGFPGSVGLPGAVLGAAAEQVLSELARQQFKSILLVNAHYENAEPFYEAADRVVSANPGTTVVLLSWWDLIDPSECEDAFPEGFPGWPAEHASVLETALMEELRPDLVRAESKIDGSPRRVLPYDVFPVPSDIISANGILYTARYANKELGATILALLTSRISSIIDEQLQSPSSMIAREG